MAIGVFDSGLGGLTVLRAIRRRLPNQDVVFFGDNTNAPYGTKSEAEIRRLTQAGVVRLFGEGCGMVILACNTASAVALRAMQEEWLPQAAPSRRVLGVFVPVIEALTGRPWAYHGPPAPARVQRVALFATPATIGSNAFRRELAFRATGLEVAQIACPGIVDALEAGDSTGADALAGDYARRLLAAMPDPQAAVLGCTHYPLVEPAFRAALPAGTEVLSQPDIVAESLADYLRRHPRFAGGSGRLRLLTSGDPAQVSGGARLFLGHAEQFAAA